MPQFINFPMTCRGNQSSWQDEAILSIDFIFGGALYDIYDPSSCLYPLLRSEKDLCNYTWVRRPDEVFNYTNIKHLTAPPSLTTPSHSKRCRWRPPAAFDSGCSELLVSSWRTCSGCEVPGAVPSGRSHAGNSPPSGHDPPAAKPTNRQGWLMWTRGSLSSDDRYSNMI